MKKQLAALAVVGTGRLIGALLGFGSGGAGVADSWLGLPDAGNGPGMGTTGLGSGGGAPPGTGDDGPGDDGPGDDDEREYTDDELRGEDAPSDDFWENLLNGIMGATQSTPVGVGVAGIESTRNVKIMFEAIDSHNKRNESARDTDHRGDSHLNKGKK